MGLSVFKISRLTDYGVVLLSHMAESQRQNDVPCSAGDLALLSGLPKPTVAKLLKILAKHKVVDAKRGALGGYKLLYEPKDLSVLTLIEAFEGKPAMTSCMKEKSHNCVLDSACGQKAGWLLVHNKVREQLLKISLFDLMNAGLMMRMLP